MRSNQIQQAVVVTLVLSLIAIAQWLAPGIRLGVIFTSWKWGLAFGLGILALLTEIALLATIQRGRDDWVTSQVEKIIAPLQRAPYLSRLFFLLATLLLPILIMGPSGLYMQSLGSRLLLLWAVSILSAIFLESAWPGQRWTTYLTLSGLTNAFIYKIVTFFPDLSTYPLSLGWSEISRYYYGSLFFAKQIYGIQTPPSVLHPSRYLLQSLPFIIPSSPLWFHRLWQVFLWIGLSFASADLLVRRLGISARGLRIGTTLWAFLFLFQGPILYHLFVPVVIVLWGFDRQRFWRSLAIVALASAWAGISRVNWIPIPGLLAAALYFLEEPVDQIPIWRYLSPPVSWVLVGSAIAFASQSAYIALSGNEASQFGSSFSSDLLWYRLLPSATYPLGVLPAAAIVFSPLLLLIAHHLKKDWKQYHFIRLLAVGGMGFALFTGGVVVSTKIGGGSNLHNLDSFLILLLLIGSYLHFKKVRADWESHLPEAQLPSWVLALVIAVPTAFTLMSGGPFSPQDQARAEEVIQEIKNAAEEVNQRDEDILFISERHLVTFNVIENVPLVPDYEKVFLMEMAMSANPSYLNAFQADLQNRRFGLIVSHPLRIQYQGPAHPFGEENDAWVRNVAERVLCYYEPVTTHRDVGVQLLAPRAVGAECRP